MAQRTPTSRLQVLNEAYRKLLEAEHMGHETVLQLQVQNEVLRQTQYRLEETREELGKSKALLRRINRTWKR